MNHSCLGRLAAGTLMAIVTASVSAEPVTFIFDSSHTFPFHEADHFGGTSVWRRKVNHREGMATLHWEAGSGAIEAAMGMTTIDFGLNCMNHEAYYESRRKFHHIAADLSVTCQDHRADRLSADKESVTEG